MLRKVNLALAMCSITLLSACGGGGDSGTVTPTALVASASVFNLQSLVTSYITSTGSSAFTVTGTVSNVAVSGTGTVTNGAVSSGTFEGVSALQKTSTVIGTLSANGINVPIASSSVGWYDTNYVPIGVNGSEYSVVNGTATLPVSARINDTGPFYTATRYTNSSKTSSLGTMTVTYVVEADTASSALLTLINTYKNRLGTTTQIATVQVRITPANGFTRIKETVTDIGANTALVYSY